MNALSKDLQMFQHSQIILNNFQVASYRQVIYAMDLVRTGDISGERIVPYRMAETRLGSL